MSNVHLILALVRAHPGLSDAGLCQRSGVEPHQQVNQICRGLEKKGLIRRERAPSGRIVNVPVEDGRPAAAPESGESDSPPRSAPEGGTASVSPRGAPDNPPLLGIPFSGERGEPKRQGPPGGLALVPDPQEMQTPVSATALRLLVVSTCSRRKIVDHPHHLVQDDFADPARLAAREQQLAPWLRPAVEMYQGREHALVTEAVGSLRTTLGGNVRHRIISAGYGLITPERRIAPYDVTFNDMDIGDIAPWADRIGVRRDLEDELGSAEVAILLLGTRYLWAIEPRRLLPRREQRLVFVAAPSQARRIGRRADITLVAAGMTDATRRGVDNYVQKGWLLQQFAAGLAKAGPGALNALLHDESPRTFLRLAETT